MSCITCDGIGDVMTQTGGWRTCPSCKGKSTEDTEAAEIRKREVEEGE